MSARGRVCADLRRPTPLPAALAAVWSEYVAASVAAGMIGADTWRLARVRDGSVWLTVDSGERAGDGIRFGHSRGRRRPTAHRTRIARDTAGAVDVLTKHLAGLNALIASATVKA
ncbi:hypothetical protein SEA_MACGULLY_98 [Rhodococcus phage MacGully]|nr:hypothetical protein SEA_MACGULLY_98 [Rhodococcus phage MacGully]